METTTKYLDIALEDIIRIPTEIDVSEIDHIRIRIIKKSFPIDIDGTTLYPPRPIKPPFIIKDMINNLICSYGVSFTEREKKAAEEFFISVNYYKFCIYPKLISKNPSFKDVMHIYSFDNILREHLLGLIPRIEAYVKTSWAYYTSNNRSKICEELEICNDFPAGLIYLNKGIYQTKDLNSGIVDDMLHDLALEMLSRRKQELTVSHHIINYGGHMPIWAVVEQMTFGKISTMITCVKRQVRKSWVETYFQNLNSSPKNITSWIHCCVVLRNISFHGGRLYGRTFTYSPSFDSSDSVFMEYSKEEFNKIRPTLFSGLIVMKRIFSKLSKADIKQWNKFIYILSKNIYHSNQIIDIDRMGFPENWKELLTIVNA